MSGLVWLLLIILILVLIFRGIGALFWIILVFINFSINILSNIISNSLIKLI